MNDLQKCELDILKEFDRICKANNLSYSLNSGTMLGAVRHKGFIPWDDDIDVMMPAKDYRRFCKIAPKQLDGKFFLQTSYTDLWYGAFGKLRMNGTTAIEEGLNSCNFHQGVGVDIFPLIGVPESEAKTRILDNLYHVRNILIKDLIYEIHYSDRPELMKKVRAIMRLPLSFRRFVCKILDCIILKDPEDKKYFCYLLPGGSIYKRFLTEDIKRYIPMKFEDSDFPVAIGYDRMLTQTFGDYMTPPPVEKRNGGDHVFAIVDVNNDYHKYIEG